MAFTRFVAAFTAASFLALGFQATASATMIGTQDYLAGIDRAATIDTVQAQLARADVRDAMVALGVDPVAASERVGGLSDEELARVAGQLDELPAGGDVLAVIGIVFVVLLILELTGVIDIFKKT
jgi:hypothetical protein